MGKVQEGSGEGAACRGKGGEKVGERWDKSGLGRRIGVKEPGAQALLGPRFPLSPGECGQRWKRVSLGRASSLDSAPVWLFLQVRPPLSRLPHLLTSSSAASK